MGKDCSGCAMTMIAMILVVVGAINWGLVGAFNFDLVQFLFTETLGMAVVAKIVYILVGLSGVLIGYKKFMCGSCSK